MRKFFFTIILPALLAILLFVVVIYVIVVPGFEKAILDRKKEMLKELTNIAWSLVKEYDDEYRRGVISLPEARKLAAEKIGRMRYGEEGKDYFWITDMHPFMVMHPYRQELDSTDLTDYTDPAGNHLFMEAARIVKDSGEGFVDYIWQWKDDSLRVVPKLSFVKGYEEWGWIIGTGIYLEDVAAEIRSLEKNLLTISSLITGLVFIILFYIVRQSLTIENRRKKAERSLRFSRRKYKALVEASTEGTIMTVEDKVIFANQHVRRMIGDTGGPVEGRSITEILETDWDSLNKRMAGNDRSVSTEAVLKCSDGEAKEVVVNVSRVIQDGRPGNIIIMREAGGRALPMADLLGLSEEIQASVLIMGQPVKAFATEPVFIGINKSVEEAAILINRRKTGSLLVRSDDMTVGIITALDIVTRVVAGRLPFTTKAGEIMTSPVLTIPEESTILEAVYHLHKNRITTTGITGPGGNITGIINIADLREAQDSSLTYAARQAEMASSVQELRSIYSKVPLVVTAFLEGGGNIKSLLQVITSITDAITRQVIRLAISEMGEPPVPFVFIALGSEGRGEQTLFTDQDNAIIYSNEADGNAVAVTWFLELGKRINNDLAATGFKLCDGNVMSGNPMWNTTLQGWKDHFEGWIMASDPVSILDSNIFFDFRPVYGDFSICEELRQSIKHISMQPGQFHFHMASSVTKFRIPAGGSLLTGSEEPEGNGDPDMKKMVTPIVSYARLMAIINGVEETNTIDRLRETLKKGALGEESFNELNFAYTHLMRLRLRAQAASMIAGLAPSNRIDISSLNSIEKGTLKKVLALVANMQSAVATKFRLT